MKLLILNGPAERASRYNPQYRGTYRAHPRHFDGLADSHEANQLFFWFLEEGGERGVVSDIEKARRLAELSNEYHGSPDKFEVVEVKDAGQHSSMNSQFLGIDLSAGYNYSLLWWGLRSVTAVESPSAIQSLTSPLNERYAPELNQWGLFDTWETASSCLHAMKALQSLSPGLYEAGDLSQFAPCWLYLVSEHK